MNYPLKSVKQMKQSHSRQAQYQDLMNLFNPVKEVSNKHLLKESTDYPRQKNVQSTQSINSQEENRTPSPSSSPQSSHWFKVNQRLVEQSLRFIIDLDQQGNYQFYGSSTESLNEGGLFIPTELLTQIGNRVLIKVQSKNFPSFILKGEIQWIREPLTSNQSLESGIGVRFLNITPKQKKRLEGYLTQEKLHFYID